MSQEQNHESQVNQSQSDDMLEVFGHKSHRSILRLSRGILSQTVRKELQRLEWTTQNRPVTLFTTYNNSHMTKTVVLNRENNKDEIDHAIVIVNKIRDPLPSEPNYPNGETMEIFDLAIPYMSSKWYNTATEILYNYHNNPSWAMPTRATFIRPRQENLEVELIGPKPGIELFTPQPARNIPDIELDAHVLWGVYESLRFCNEVALEQHVTKFTVK